MVEYISAKDVQKTYKVSVGALRKWADSGKLRFRQSPGGKRFYDKAHLQELFGEPIEEAREDPDKHNYIYARVSSKKQEPDLVRQIEDLRESYPDYEVISDIGSGLNYKRKGLLSLLDKVDKGMVGEIVVTHKDRLARYGVEIIDWIFKVNNVSFVVLCTSEDAEDTNELSQDLLAVTTFFVARNNGRRSAKNRQRRRETLASKGESGVGKESGESKATETRYFEEDED